MSATGASSLVIRTMSRAEIDIAADWAAAEGWNPGLTDAATFYAADHGGFLVALLDGEPVACISATHYGDGFGFLGFYIVRPELRGNGYGLRIWQAATERLAGRNVGLDGVLAQQANYERSGFRLAYRNVRFEGKTWQAPRPEDIVEAASLPFEQLAALDQRHFAAPRPAFLRAWLTAEGSTALASVSGGALTGCGVIRPCRSGYKVGPLFAPDSATADALLDGLCGAVPEGSPFTLDVPEPNAEAVHLAEAHAMRPVFETARMYSRGEPGLPLGSIYGVTSFELG